MPSSGVQTCALRSEEHTSELQSHDNIVCRLLLEKTRGRGDLRRTRPSEHAVPPARCAAQVDPCRRGQLMPGTPTPRSRLFFNDTASTETASASLNSSRPI